MALERRGLNCFMSGKDLQAGDDWAERIRAALLASRELCLILSQASKDREWVLTEWGGAWLIQRRITPVLVDCEIHDIPERLQLQCIKPDYIETYATELIERRSVRVQPIK